VGPGSSRGFGPIRSLGDTSGASVTRPPPRPTSPEGFYTDYRLARASTPETGPRNGPTPYPVRPYRFPWLRRDRFRARGTLGTDTPEISVVIPTCQRPRQLVEAIASVVAQSHHDWEVVVVVDGPNPETDAAIASIADQRVRTVSLPERRGASEARNRGVQAARGRWVAFLDDDDTWLPAKLEKQRQIARAATAPFPIVSCRVLARAGHAEHRWPRRFPAAGEPLAEYLFCRSTFFSGEGLLQTSTWFVPRELLLLYPFDRELRAMEDLEWLLRVARDPRVQVVFVDGEPLATWNIQAGRERLSGSIPWDFRVAWAKRYRGLLSPRAYAGLLLTQAGYWAARDRAWAGLVRLPAEAFRGGAPSWREMVVYAGYWLVPGRVAEALAGGFAFLHHRFKRKDR
jgi:glycosyltransferase involved in cell wall biosynthesis